MFRVIDIKVSDVSNPDTATVPPWCVVRVLLDRICQNRGSE
jgi:hypothetical protein